MLNHHLRAAVVLVFASGLFAAELRPLGDLAGFIEPDTPAVVRWEVEKGELPAKIDYVIRDYVEREVTRGTIDFVAGKPLELSVKLPQGYYDIELTGAAQRYGLVALPQPPKEPHPFFCIDAAMSWLVRDEALRVALVKKLARCGIRTARERVTWGAINPAEGKYDWETPARYESLRKLYAANGIKVLEMFHDAPAWTGRVGKYPDDLVATAKAWRDIRARWGQYWCGLEVWNEPDIFFGGDLPADQYAALAKAFAPAYSAQTEHALLIGAYAHYNAAFMENAAENGIQSCSRDASFHTYDRAPAMAALIGRYRESRACQGASLWLTECGRPWKKGPPRPPRTEDAESALDIAMKAVESCQHGVHRYFAFVYPYYEENENNFGMTDRRALPLRSMAAYARLASLCGPNVSTAAALKVTADAPLTRVIQTVDRDDKLQTIAIIYTGKVDAARTVRVALPILRVEGIDGRELRATDDVIPVPDGLSYVWLDAAKLPKAEGLSRSREEFERPPGGIFAADLDIPFRASGPAGLVLRFEWDKDALRPCKEGYRVAMERVAKVPLMFHAFSFVPCELTCKLDIGDARVRPLGNAGPWKLSMKPGGRESFSCDVDLRDAFTQQDAITLTVRTGVGDRLAIRLIGEPTFEQLLQRYPNHVKLPIDDLSRWQHGAPGHAKDEITKADGGWRLKASFSAGDRWCYPRFTLPEDVDLSKATALVVRARCQKRAMVRVFLWEGEGVGYITNGSIIPADGQWHTATVRFSDLTLSGANASDPNGKLDLDKVRRISLGFNSDAAENELEVSDAFVVTAPSGK